MPRPTGIGSVDRVIDGFVVVAPLYIMNSTAEGAVRPLLFVQILVGTSVLFALFSLFT
jgi:hypothetical protein